MAKLLISPLPWFLIMCLVCAVIGSVGRERSLKKSAAIVLLVLSVVMWLLSVPAISSSLADSLWLTDSGKPVPRTRPIVVIVLAGGSFRAIDGQNYLSSATTDRVVTGVRVFFVSHAYKIVMSGRSGTGPPTSQVELMKGLAFTLGVPGDRIALDPRSRNTFEHPRELLRGGLASPSDRLLVVTEPIHLRRALIEFRKLFPFSAPFPTPRYPMPARMKIESWLPQVDSLTESTRCISEWAGITWYSVLYRAQRGRQQALIFSHQARDYSQCTPAILRMNRCQLNRNGAGRSG